MLISSIEIIGFKSIDSLKMDFDKFTSILGSNNAGKSTILRAIEIFFEAAPKISGHDHFGRDTSKPILITITFSKLTPSEMKEFSNSIVDQTLTITREVSSSDRSGGYAIYRKSHPNFQDFYNESSKTEKRKIYTEIRKQFSDLAAAPRAMTESGVWAV
ncbi:AAA family ATPase [Hoeflea sp. IMCC20628]|uniref:AAA family ATPase n=1 Tax=Hoeflea sp. IMCC20628 TaxID=1620421 RepID=UPI0009E52778|nr:AAA family ATPase [Hoeflea sp. IMCC20628]